jgi:hypothetical protein
MSVVTVEELKAKLGIPAEPPDPALDARLQSMLDETQAMVEGYIGMAIEPTPLTMWSGQGICGSATFALPVYPVISLDMVTIQGEEQDLAEFWLSQADGLVYPADACGCARGGCFCCCPGPSRVDYTAGFDPVPDDLYYALLNLSADYYAGNAGSTATTFGGDRVKSVTIFGAMSIGFDGGSSASSASSSSGLEVPPFLQSWTWVLDKYQVRSLIVE